LLALLWLAWLPLLAGAYGPAAPARFGRPAAAPPTLNAGGISPASGAPGTSVSLTGSNLTAVTSVTFTSSGGTATNAANTYTIVSSTSITGVVVPAGLGAGAYTMTATNNYGTSNGLPFTVVAPTPLTVSSRSPARNARAAARSTNVGITFNQALNTTTAANVRVFSAQRGGQLVRGGNATASGSTLTVDPANDLKPGETVRVTVPATISSSTGVAATPQVYQFTAAVAGSTATFAAPVNNPDPGVPNFVRSGLALGDVDNDGDLDLLVANPNNSTSAYTISVRLNNGAGSFTGGSEISLSDTPEDLTLGDVNGDGNLDLVATYYVGVAVRFGNGAGGFSGGSDVGAGRNPQDVMLGDVDADGDLDILVSNYNDYNVSILLNNGSGSFAGSSTVAVASGNPFALAAADLDADGDLDLLVANGNAVAVRLNNGSGSFGGGTDVGVGANSIGLTVADLDGDGDLDFASPSLTGNTVYVRFNDGLGGFPTGTTVGVGSNCYRLTSGDVDGDGDIDLLAANAGNNNVSVCLNSGTGGFTNTAAVGTGAFPFSIVLGDVDGDGDLDFVTGNSTGHSASVRLNVLPPTITSFMPTTGAIGASITITGTELANATSVSFNGGVQTTITSNTATSLTVAVPATASTGPLTVTTIGGTSAASSQTFTFIQPPLLSSFTPTTGSAGTSVTLTGTNLQGASSVSFNGVLQTTITNSTSTSLTVAVPATATTGPLVVTTPGGSTAPSSQVFTVVPVISSFAPTSGGVGSSVTITGTGLGGATSVSFNGAAQTTITANTTTSLMVAVPAGASTGPLTVTTAGGPSAASSQTFTFIANPTISSFTPTTGPVGTSVIITGTNFGGTTVVAFSGPASTSVAAASFTLDSPTQITAVVAVGSISGPISITTSNGAGISMGTSTASFTVPPLTITALTPARNALTAPVTTALALGFSQNIDASTAGNVRVFSAQYRGRRTAMAAVSTNTITLTPTVPANGSPVAAFLPGETVQVTVPATVKATTGAAVVPQVYQFTTAVTGGSGIFAAPATDANPAMGTRPYGVAVGDLNNDGYLDMVAANNGSTNVSVRLNNGAGSFPTAATNYTVGSVPYSVALGDMDGDGDLDLLAVNSSSNSVSVRFNDGTGGFATLTTVNGVATGPRSIAVGDVDGDGDLDFVTANFTTSNVSVRFNGGAGNFTVPTTNPNPAVGTNPTGVALGDVDGDGDLDLLTANNGTSANSVSVRLNDGTGNFGTLVTITGITRPQALALGDVDGDGDLDLLTANLGNSVSVRLNQGGAQGGTAGTFAPPATNANITVGSAPRSIVLGDVDADGDLDALVGNAGTNAVSVSLLKNSGTGSFTIPTTNSAFAVGSLPFGLALGDVDNDGDLDLLAANGGTTGTINSVSVRLNQPGLPVITSFTPATGPAGTSVTVTGTNLAGATAATVNGTAGTVVSSTGGSLTFTVGAGSTTGALTVTTPGGTSAASTAVFTLVYLDLTISAGTLGTPIAVPAGTYNSITVAGPGIAQLTGAVVVNTAVVVNGMLLTNCQALTGAGTFTLNAGATLDICDVNGISASGSTGAVQTSGTRSFSPAASYVYSSPDVDPQPAGTGLPATVRNLTNAASGGLYLTQAVGIREVLALPTTSNLDLNNQALTLLSDVNGTALVANTGGGIVTGNTATLQRHIETNVASGGYRHYASPMVATAGAETLATLATTGYTPDFGGAAAYNSSATPSLVTPFPTVFLYNQDRIASTSSNYDTFSKGWQAALGSEMPQVGRGYSVQAPGAALVDFTGTLTSGSVSRSNLQRASADPTTGWHLLGNPFPSPLDWSTMTLGAGQNLENMDGALYVFQSSGPYTGQYRTYLAALPAGNSPIVPSGSGFFVHTTSPATAGLVRFNANNRVTSFGAQPAFGRGSSPRPVLTLALAGATTDAVTLYLDPAATAGVDAAYDATKLTNPSGLNLAVLSGSTPLAIAGLPAPTTTTVLPLALAVPSAGTYTLHVEELTNFTTLPVYLRDAQAGTEQLLTPGYMVSVTLAAGTTTRFSLVLRPAGALATAGPVLAAQASIYPNPAQAAFTLTLPPVAGATHATATLLNTLGQVVNTRTLALPAGGATAAYSTAGLAAGVYALRLQAGGETATLRVVVE
jgi:hypothetical protein